MAQKDRFYSPVAISAAAAVHCGFKVFPFHGYL